MYSYYVFRYTYAGCLYNRGTVREEVIPREKISRRCGMKFLHMRWGETATCKNKSY